MILLCFGNLYLEQDNLALKVGNLIKSADNIEVVFCCNSDDVLQYMNDEFIILDVVKDLKNVVLIDDVDILKSKNIVSMHDFDLQFFLKLLKEMGKLKKIKIIGIPQSGNPALIKEKVINLIQFLNQENE